MQQSDFSPTFYATLGLSKGLGLSGNYRFPAEWEMQSGVLITWPHQKTDWAENLATIELFFIELAKAISAFEKVLIITYDEAHKQHVAEILNIHRIALQQVVFFQAPTNDTWTRDYGPLYLINDNEIKCMNFTFNAWGNKFDAAKDNLITTKLLKQNILFNTENATFDFVLEGGSIDSDGAGTLLTTKHCLLNKNRNPGLSALQISEFIKTQFSLSKILWLSEGLIVGDDTDSHIDMLARFTDAKTIVYASCEDKTDPHYLPLLKMQQELQSFRTISGDCYDLHALPIPAAIVDSKGNRLPASYANFLIINKAVLLPVYADPHDEIALDVLQSCFPDRSVIPIDARAAITQGGSLHCLTMQLIKGVLN